MENANQLSVKTTKGGPYVINGNFKLDLPSGETRECTGKTSLCRCGKSHNKPFCDQSHNKCVIDTCNPWF
jgi:CDGSH-type Zn-finger protein